MAATDPKKDIVYIDIEDDITSVIEKVKGASATIVALVPPKRIGVLQSVVNLKLLQRAATTAKKRVVLITNDQALIGLAASLAMPVAKNLQSRPEVPAVAQTPQTDDVINGDELPVGELAKTSDEPLDLSDIPVTNEPGAAPAAAVPFAAKAAARAPKKGVKIPNFDTFRKKMFIFGGLGALLLVFLIWAIFFAGKATVAITAKTNVVNINKQLQLREGAKLDAEQAVAPVLIKTTKKTATVDFAPTGKREVGEKATGTVQFSTDSIAVAKSNPTIPAGTVLSSSSGKSFTTDQTVTLSLTESEGSTSVTATARGASFNGASGSVTGAPDGVSASFASPTGGGTDKTATVVSQSDFDNAEQKLEATDSNDIKKEMKKEFDKDLVVIEESFTVEPGNSTSTPAVGQEATSAKMSAETTYTLIAVSRANLRNILDADTKLQTKNEINQKIYESGDESVKFTEFNKVDKGYTVRAQASAQVGPNINEKELATQLIGKRAGEIQQQIEAIQGVEDVAVKFSPFWKTKAPSKADKISIKFVVKHD